MNLRSWAIAAVLTAGLAQAQTATVGSLDGTRGANLPPTSVAWIDEATALAQNPAGLGRAGPLSAIFLHERSNSRGLDADGLWLSATVAGLVGAGLSFEALATPQGPARARTALGLSVGPQALSAGAGLVWHFGATGRPPSLGLDLGLQSRPLRWLALGALLRNAVAPSAAGSSAAGSSAAREVTVGLGLRPFGERLTVGIDWVAAAFPGTLGEALAHSRLQYTLSARVVEGLSVLAGVSHGFSAGAPLALQVGLGLDAEHLGYTQGASFREGRTDWQFLARVSSEAHQNLIPTRSIAVVSLGGLGDSTPSTVASLLGLASPDRFLRLLRTLDRAATDPHLVAVVLKVETSSLGLARAGELRAAVVALRKAGKRVYAYLLSAGDPEYLVASACDRIDAAPESMILVDGLRSQVTFFGGAAEQLGITVDVARVGAYKSFTEQFTRQAMSPEQREAITAYLDAATRSVEEQVLARRALTPQHWHESLGEGLKTAQRAVELGLIDGLVTPQAFEEALRTQHPEASVDRGYDPFSTRDERWGSPRRIAIVPLLGSITGGKNQASPLGGDTSAGAESFISAMADASADASVAAIVVRIDSGGGDGLASYLMYQAVLEAKKRKPVVVSMGDAAASGGYYVAAGAHEIVASATTLTGSIGVFFAKPAVKGLAARWGITQESITRGAPAGLSDLYEPWTEDQRAAAQRWVDAFYATFVGEVAANRSLTREQVDAVARGRVWSGIEARAHGLVDRVGGLLDAVAAARRRAGIAEDERDVDLVLWRSSRTLGQDLLSSAAPPALLALELPSGSIPAALEPLVRHLGAQAWLLGEPRVQARLEAEVDVR